jgi:malonyl-CoA/methylmalonyl-CoA synthetase
LSDFGFYAGTSHPEPELEYHILDSGSKNILVSDSYYQKLEPIAKKHNLKLFNLANIPNEAPASDAPVHDIDPSRRAQIIYTSGTTGKPKGVVTTHEIIASQVKTLVDAWEWQGTDHIRMSSSITSNLS